MLCTRCSTENPPQARYCLNCGAALAARCANCQSELSAGARFCMFCGEPVITQTPLDQRRHQALAAAAPDALLAKLRACPPLTGERRQVTVLLVDVVGSTALCEQVSEAAWSDILNELFDALTPPIFRYEGTLVRLLGDSLLAFFGAPVAHEDDPVRGVHAGLEALAAGRELGSELEKRYGVRLEVRACLHTGEIESGQLREDLHFEYTDIGDTTNLVSRIKFAAGPNTLLVTSDTQRFIAPMFELEDLGDLTVKGERSLVRIYRVQGRKTRPGSLRGLAGLESPMVGREMELQSLLRQCETVRAGLGRAVVISGEPGLGKTRLISEWQRVVLGPGLGAALTWTQGRSQSYGAAAAYQLLVDWLRDVMGAPYGTEEVDLQEALSRLLAELPEVQAEKHPMIHHLLSLPLPPEQVAPIEALDAETLRGQYQTAVLQVVRGLAARQRLVIVLEDLHWADPSSVDVFRQVLPLVNELPILLCLVIREDPDSSGWELVTAARQILRGSLIELNLAPLTEADSRMLVSNLLAVEALPERVRQIILKKAEGNPLFVEEVLRMLIDRGAIQRKDGGWSAVREIESVDIPDTLQALLMARIDRLPEEVREILRVAAVIGRQFPVRVLAEVLERSPNGEPADPTEHA